MRIMVPLFAFMLAGCAGDRLGSSTPVSPASAGTDRR
jgi:hypothetical protein